MTRALRFLPLIVTAMLAIVLLNRCGQNFPQAPSGSFTNVYETFKTTNCQECHNPKTATWKEDGVTSFDMTSQKTAYKTLLESTVSAKSSKTICKGVKLVTKSNIDKSYLAGVMLETVAKDDFAGVKGCTPYSVHLTDAGGKFFNGDKQANKDARASLRKWITDGAKDD